ncbi:polyhydroxybutyrate depolymerase [Rhizobium sp. Root274]|uniref:alpha/beta hydrolase family esterase n=1 Tax=unclassified Rhizobium TaxID=2613769 RepID=UPI000713BEE1|nr:MULTISPECIES: polyhydroxybutyrate depolymerase [unclassified Rhizobium]KQW29173.1 polyhydroxybutyrate depolymerase [Rhizobium sp. Root1240]KRD29369.1 polyhydroxybutyrate depolymerase [Rhizobium sp. Root274]
MTTTSTVLPLVRARGALRVVAGLFLFGLSGAAAQAAGCGAAFEAGQHSLTFQSGGVTREAVYVIPSNYTGKKKVPLVFDFHGSNSNPTVQLKRSHWDEVAEREGFVVMALAGSLKGELPNTHAWNVPGVTQGEGADESLAIRDAVKLAKDTLCIDSTKIYASGYSGGGRMLSQYICNGFGDFAAAGFVMGLRAGTPVEENGVWRPRRESCQPSRPVSIIAFSGMKDHVNPFDGGGKAYWRYGGEVALNRWAELNGCNTRPQTETGTSADVSRYLGCRAGTSVMSYVIANADHAWPARSVLFQLASTGDKTIREVDATDRMWDFFRTSGGDLMAGNTVGASCTDGQTTASIENGGQGKTCKQASTRDNSVPVVSGDL